MRLHNTLSRRVDEFRPLEGDQVNLYSCGPTVYDHIHIGNLSAFIAADTLRRALKKASGYNVRHVMNFTDVDDKTIRRSREVYPDMAPEVALKKLTDEYKQIFLDDMEAIGNDGGAVNFVSAVDTISDMQELIRRLHHDGFAYIADDGVYFSIERYRASGKKYGQLSEISQANTAQARIQNDEYDKESVHDFALWKTRKEGEPAWGFELDGHDLLGRPGWHIECSAMSAKLLGQPFDIHTGGVDLIFPHHENEIAQSTAGAGDIFANWFVHNEHLLVDGRKMSKSLNNFYTLRDIREHGFDPMAFRLLVLQSHYRNQSNFTWENLEAAANRLKHWQAVADLRWQADDSVELNEENLLDSLQNDVDTPTVLSQIDKYFDETESSFSYPDARSLRLINQLLGINLQRDDITEDIKTLLSQRDQAREVKDFGKSDELREKLNEQGIEVKDTPNGQVWSRA